MTRLAAVDAQTYWMSAKIPNDQFLLYGFEGVAGHLDAAMAAVRRNVSDCPELLVRIDDSDSRRYPVWVAGGVGETSTVRHEFEDGTWSGCLQAVAALADDQLDATTQPWRLHLFSDVDGVPGVLGTGTVAVVQISHALGDGNRSSALAARLFGRAQPVPAALPRRRGTWALPYLALRASAAHRRLVRDTDAGVVAAPSDSWPRRQTNDAPGAPYTLRTLVRPRAQLPGPTVTVSVLAAVAEALAAELDDVTALGAEVPMAKSGVRHANNHFGNVSVALHPQLPFAARAARIHAELDARRQRFQHPALAAADAAFAATPAPLLRWGMAQFDPEARSATVDGNTVVSSVNRGPADLTFGGCAVAMTAGFPALSPMMGLTHGVHGIGDVVAVSVHAAQSALPDVDAYVDRLAAVLDARVR